MRVDDICKICHAALLLYESTPIRRCRRAVMPLFCSRCALKSHNDTHIIRRGYTPRHRRYGDTERRHGDAPYVADYKMRDIAIRHAAPRQPARFVYILLAGGLIA